MYSMNIFAIIEWLIVSGPGLTNQLVSVTMVWSSLSCKDKHGRLLMVLSHTHLVHDACRFVALHTYAMWDIHVYNIASIIPSHQSNFSMYASMISNDSTIIYSGALLFSPWFLLSHTTLLHLIPHAGHITESVVVASLGELLPQTSMEVRRSGCILELAVMRIWSSLKYANIIIIGQLYLLYTHIYRYVYLNIYIYTLIYIYIYIYIYIFMIIYVGMLCSKDLASHTLCNLHSIDIFVNRWIHLCIPFLLVVSPVYIGIYGDACA